MNLEAEKKALIEQYFSPSKHKSDAELRKDHQSIFWRDTNGGKLYKYRKINKNTIEAIKTNELYCSNPKDFNDPFDCNLGIQPDSFTLSLFSINKDRRTKLLKSLSSVASGASKITDYPPEYQEILDRIFNNDIILKTLSKPIGKIETTAEKLDFMSLHSECLMEIFRIIFSSDIFGIPGVHCPDDLIDIYNNSSIEGKKELLADEPDIYKFAISNGITADVDDIDRAEMLSKKLLPDKGDLYLASEPPKTTIENFNICCLATEYTNRLMWAHYANNHSGVCIEYDFKNIESMTGPYFPYPVSYSENRPPIPCIDMLSATPLTQKEMVNAVIKGLLTKDKVWEYENEWRFIIPQKENFLKLPKISAIYLGANVKEHNKRVIINLGKSLGIPVKQMVIDRGIYALHAKDV